MIESYRCLMCGYIYDAALGDRQSSVAPETAFEELPNDWLCPECGAVKDRFELIQE